MDCSLPSSSVHGILQARILEWVAIPFSRGSSQPRDRTQVSCIAGGFFTTWTTREAPKKVRGYQTRWNRIFQLSWETMIPHVSSSAGHLQCLPLLITTPLVPLLSSLSQPYLQKPSPLHLEVKTFPPKWIILQLPVANIIFVYTPSLSICQNHFQIQFHFHTQSLWSQQEWPLNFKYKLPGNTFNFENKMWPLCNGGAKVNLGDDLKREGRKSVLFLVMKGCFIYKFQKINTPSSRVLIQNALGQSWFEN